MASCAATCDYSLIDLPGDVILLILRKLAVLDPCSLLPATCAFRAFRQQVKNNPGIWKLAFFGKESMLEDRSREEQIENGVNSLGGYEKLVKIRTWRECPELLRSSEQTRESKRLSGKSAQTLPEDSWWGLFPGATKYLVELRNESGGLLLWSLHTADSNAPGPYLSQNTGDFELWGLSLRREGGNHTNLLLRTSQPGPSGPVSMEIYLFRDCMDVFLPLMRGESRVTRPWKCGIAFKDKHIIDLTGCFCVVSPTTEENKGIAPKSPKHFCCAIL